MKGQLFVLSAPAGAGKTTLVQRLTREYPWIVQSISYTTRKPRPFEKEGVHYRFIDPTEFENCRASGDLLEWACIYGDYYGTSKAWVESKLDEGKQVVLVIDTQGAAQLRDKIVSTSIFIEPPSLAVLKSRMEKRNTETSATIEKRLKWAAEEMKAAPLYDIRIVNDDLEVAYGQLKSIFLEKYYGNQDSLNK